MERVETVADMLRALARLIVDEPDEVVVETVMNGSGVLYRVRVSQRDHGKLIGRGGRTARSLRQILQAVSMTQKLKFNLDIAE